MSGLFGGRSSSSSSSTQNQNYDQRQVNDASGGGIIGSRNAVSSYQYDLVNNDSSRYSLDASSRSNTSIDASQSFTDWSDRSINDNSDRRVSIDNRVTTDGGAFDIVRNVADGLGQFGMAQVGLARDLASRADAVSGGAVDFAVKAQEQAASFADDQAGRAFDLARSSAAQAFASNADALGFVRETFADAVGLARGAMQQAQQSASTAADTAGAAYAAASSSATGNKTLIVAGMAVVGLAAVALIFRKG